MFVKNINRQLEDLGDGVSRKILSYSEEMMMVEVYFEEGSVGTIHAHPHLQCSYVAKGSFAVTIGEGTEVLVEGDSFYVDSDLPHGVKALAKGVLIDVFNPVRKDFLSE